MERHYLVVDLEATCDSVGFDRDDMEIIEIGAVLVAPGNLLPVAEWQTFVRPVIRPQLTPFCTELTSITQADVDGAPGFAAAMQALTAFLDRPILLASWGAYDKNQFQKDARRHGVRLPLGKGHLNLKEAFSQSQGTRRLGMAGALAAAKIPLTGTHHRGIDDARNIAKLLPYALGKKHI